MSLHDVPWPQLLQLPVRYIILYGGRGGGKTWAIAQEIIRRCYLQPLRVACLRETQVSIKDSVKAVLEDTIRRCNLVNFFDVTRNEIRAKNGSRIIFQGLSDQTADSIKGLEGIDIVWIEQGERISHRSLELLLPTIRKPGSQILVSMNPESRTDAIYQAFLADDAPRARQAVLIKVNYDHNPAYPIEEIELERLADLESQPERYAHIWLGEPDDEGDVRKVLPYKLARLCMEAWHLRGDGEEGAVFAGLDVADTGTDFNALVLRKGSCIFHVERWRGLTTGVTARRAHEISERHNAILLSYDQGGPGAGIRSSMAEIGPAYGVTPENFGGAPKGAVLTYTRGTTNADFFQYRNAQMGWALRLRAQNTEKLLAGEDMPRHRCLFINPDIPHIESFLAELTVPEWTLTPNGKVSVDKQPRPEGGGARPPSPDRYDAAILSFAHASQRGLKLG